MPGFQLALKCAEIYERDPSVEGLILIKHGIFTWGKTAKESYDRMISFVQTAEDYIDEKAKPLSAPAVTKGEGGHRWAAALRKKFLTPKISGRRRLRKFTGYDVFRKSSRIEKNRFARAPHSGSCHSHQKDSGNYE